MIYNDLQQITILLHFYYNPITINYSDDYNHLQSFTTHYNLITINYNDLQQITILLHFNYNPITMIYNDLQPITIQLQSLTRRLQYITMIYNKLQFYYNSITILLQFYYIYNQLQ